MFFLRLEMPEDSYRDSSATRDPALHPHARATASVRGVSGTTIEFDEWLCSSRSISEEPGKSISMDPMEPSGSRAAGCSASSLITWAASFRMSSPLFRKTRSSVGAPPPHISRPAVSRLLHRPFRERITHAAASGFSSPFMR